MRAYVDTSCLVAGALGEPGAGSLQARMTHFELFSSNLLEAELRSALAREGFSGDHAERLEGISWVFPSRPLTAEFQRILGAGYLKGADLWHLACALFLSPDGRDFAFLTLDKKQSAVAAELGFSAPMPVS